jgi:hypothetical protein
MMMAKSRDPQTSHSAISAGKILILPVSFCKIFEAFFLINGALKKYQKNIFPGALF